MGKYIIDLGSRFQAGFGFVAKNVAPRLLNIGYNGNFIYGNIDVFERGDKAFDELRLSGNGYNLAFGAIPFVSGNYGLVSALLPDRKSENNVFAPPPMISFSRSKNIKVTEINDSDVEVVENFGNKSWEVKIQGILIDPENHWYPGAWVRTLNEVFAVNKPYKVTSDLFRDHGIDWVYFTSLESSGIAGFEDTWKFNLEARSIRPVEFEL